MRGIDSESKSLEVFNLLKNTLELFPVISDARKWSNPSGFQHKSRVYELKNDNGCIWATLGAWTSTSSNEINRYGILTTLPDNGKNTTALSQIFEVNIPLFFSKRFNTRIFEENGIIEIRNYGRFTVGTRGLSRKVFFDYLRNNNYSDEILTDEEGNEYVCIFRISGDIIDRETFQNRLVKLTLLIDKFKRQLRKQAI